MGYPAKVQLIKRKQSEQLYIKFPAAIAQAMEFDRGETVEWIVEAKQPSPVKPNRKAAKERWDDYRIAQQAMRVSASLLHGRPEKISQNDFEIIQARWRNTDKGIDRFRVANEITECRQVAWEAVCRDVFAGLAA